MSDEQGYSGGPSGADEKQVRMWCMLCHLLALAQFTALPLGNVLGPLIIWMIKKNEMPEVDRHGKASLNFQISCFVYVLCCIPFVFLFGLGVLMMSVVGIVDLICVILAAIKANDGGFYEYPATIRFIK